MPSGMAASMRECIAHEDIDQLELETSAKSKTGYRNVIKVKNKYQARLQVPGDGRGGMRKRKQYSLPGLFDTAKEAAVLLAVIKRDMKEAYGGRVVVPPKQNKQHKARVRQQPQPAVTPPAERMHMPMATTMAMPMPCAMLHLPFAAASPLAMQPLGYTPPHLVAGISRIPSLRNCRLVDVACRLDALARV